MSESSDGAFVEEVKEKADDLGQLLDDFSERLRRMRQRNRQVQDEIASFEAGLDRLRTRLTDDLD